jgi:hypothetical protein
MKQLKLFIAEAFKSRQTTYWHYIYYIREKFLYFEKSNIYIYIYMRYEAIILIYI